MNLRNMLVGTCFTVALGMAADRPSFSGTWILDTDRSTGQVPSWAGMTIAQTGHKFRMAQNDKDGHVVRSFEGECKTDGRFHPVQGGENGSIKCKWDGSTLETNEHWNNDRNERSMRTMFAPDGTLIQEIHETGDGTAKDGHLVWKRQ